MTRNSAVALVTLTAFAGCYTEAAWRDVPIARIETSQVADKRVRVTTKTETMELRAVTVASNSLVGWDNVVDQKHTFPIDPTLKVEVWSRLRRPLYGYEVAAIVVGSVLGGAAPVLWFVGCGTCNK